MPTPRAPACMPHRCRLPVGLLAWCIALLSLTAAAQTPPRAPAVVSSSNGTVLLVTGTRGFKLSSAVYTHTQLVKNGVDADIPESRDCFDVIVKLFDRHLGKAST